MAQPETANVLLVDDRPENLLALEALLESQNLNLIRATSGEEALKHLLHHDFAVILMDVMMPGLSGFETAEIIKHRAKTRHIPIIFLTASTRDERFVTQGYSLGAVDYLMKPFEPDILKSKVGVFVDLYTQSEQLKRQAEELERANEALKEADRLKDEFLSIVSHELRTPLNFIMGFASLLDDMGEQLPPDERHLYLAKILNGADRMLLLVNDLLDFARMQAGKFRLDPQPTPFAPLVDDVASTLWLLAEDKDISLQREVDVPDLPVIDAHRVGQVLTNLLGNAIKFGPRGSEVTLRASAADGQLRVEVADTGLGIASEDLPKLFQRFQQLDMSATREAGGFGLGLSISKAIVDAHGGAIGVDSVLDQGSNFWFTLPMAGPPSDAGDAAAFHHA